MRARARNEGRCRACRAASATRRCSSSSSSTRDCSASRSAADPWQIHIQDHFKDKVQLAAPLDDGVLHYY